MTLIPFTLAFGMSLFLAGWAAQRRAEITALARVMCPHRNPTSRSKDLF
jgi:ribosome modulation factor